MLLAQIAETDKVRNGAVSPGTIPMSLDRANEYRFEARKCFEQAQRAPSDMIKARMKAIAEEWLKMAARAEAEPNI